MDGSIFTAVVRLCAQCRHLTWQPSGVCLTCQRGGRPHA